MGDMCYGAMWKLAKERAKLERGWPKSKRKQL